MLLFRVTVPPYGDQAQKMCTSLCFISDTRHLTRQLIQHDVWSAVATRLAAFCGIGVQCSARLEQELNRRCGSTAPCLGPDISYTKNTTKVRQHHPHAATHAAGLPSVVFFMRPLMVGNAAVVPVSARCMQLIKHKGGTCSTPGVHTAKQTTC